MLTLILRITGIITTIWLTKSSKLWATKISQTSILFLIGSIILIKPKTKTWKSLTWGLSKDPIKTPLILLSLWLLPVSLMARKGHLKKKRKEKTQTFITLSLIILIALIITFSTNNLIIFFLRFEATLVPTLLLIRRWGTQKERIEAGYYFIFYTLIRSLPLFLSLLTLYKKEGHTKITHFTLKKEKESPILALFCLVAFLVKVPIFGLHLWLPKAHVEAPVAGSMILAAILLKMGGYGFIRLTSIFWIPFTKKLAPIIIPFCCWGGALTSLICLTQTDLKSLIAYSSVSHMRFMIAGLASTSTWGLTGRIIVMIAHGIVSSSLFCIAKIFYERTNSRTLKIKRGLKNLYHLTPALWLIIASANLGLPPFPKAIGELLTFSAIIRKNLTKFLPIILGILFTSIFRLKIYQLLKRGTQFKWKKTNSLIKEREYLTLFLHLAPLSLLILSPKILSK